MTNKIKIEFAPGAFDQFDGTQEELDELIASIHEAVQNGDLENERRELTEEEFDELPDEVKMQLARAILENEFDEDLSEEFKRKLQ